MIASAPDDTQVQSDIRLGSFVLTSSGLKIEGDPSFAEWESVGETLRYIESRIEWWIADWLRYGEQRFGDKYAQAVDVTGQANKTLRNKNYIAGQFPVSRRRDTLSFSHHAEVASLPVDKQEELLDRAEVEDLSSRDMRQIVQAAKRHEKGLPDRIDALTQVDSIDHASGTVYLGALHVSPDLIRSVQLGQKARVIVVFEN